MATISDIAQSYYTEMGNKNIQGMEKYLHRDVNLVGPMSEMFGKDHILEAVKVLFTLFESLKIRQKFENDNNTMIVFDMICPPPIGICRVASLMTFKENLIVKIELFYDAKPFEERKKEIFSKN